MFPRKTSNLDYYDKDSEGSDRSSNSSIEKMRNVKVYNLVWQNARKPKKKRSK